MEPCTPHYGGLTGGGLVSAGTHDPSCLTTPEIRTSPGPQPAHPPEMVPAAPTTAGRAW
jgi:hypothetical protein